jgi:hypothetical protein
MEIGNPPAPFSKRGIEKMERQSDFYKVINPLFHKEGQGDITKIDTTLYSPMIDRTADKNK